jgi:DNA invertase Pin-like site-specific DNA recombinase
VRIGYARVSTTKTEQDLSIEGQEQQLLAAGCDRVIVERASAYRGRRPGWDELWAIVASGHATEVLVVDQSRLSRSGDDLDFLNACALQGVTVRALTGGVIEAETYSGFVAAGVMSVVNQAQSKLIGAKVRDGIARRRAAGHYGSGKVPFGYCVIDGQVRPHPEQHEAARVMWLQLLELQMNVSGWIKATGMPWTPRGVRTWIQNPMLRGAVRGEWGRVEPVISWAEWERAQAMLRVRSTIRGQTAHRVHLFTGLVACEACGKNLHSVRKGRQYRLTCLARHCPWYGRSIRFDVVRRQVIEALTRHHEQLGQGTGRGDQQETPEQQQLRADLANLEQLAHLPGVQELIDRQRAQLALLTVQQSAPDSKKSSLVLRHVKVLELATDEELRAIVLDFVRSIVWPGGSELVLVELR